MRQPTMADTEQTAEQSKKNHLSCHVAKQQTGDCPQAKRMRLANGAGDEGSLEQLQPQHHQQLQPQHHQQLQPQHHQQQQKLSKDGDTKSLSILSSTGEYTDVDYFRCYSSVHVHEEMLSDTVRTNAYRWAILKNYSALYKRSVLDVGAGTGILSVFAVQAGAKKVYAIEASDMAENARQVALENKMADRIEVIQQKAEDVELPEKVDAIISEWMGYCLFYESMLPTVLQARDSFLKPGGLMFPCKASLYLAPVQDQDYLHRLDFWKEMKSMYKVSMETMISAAHVCLTADADIRVIPPEAVMAHAAPVCSLDLATASCADVDHVQSPFSFRCFGHSTITGFVAWFTVDFPGGFSLSTSPYQPETHWGQTVFYLRKSFPAEQDTEIKGTFLMAPQRSSHRCREIQLDFTVNGGDQHSQSFTLSHSYTGKSPREDLSSSSQAGAATSLS